VQPLHKESEDVIAGAGVRQWIDVRRVVRAAVCLALAAMTVASTASRQITYPVASSRGRSEKVERAVRDDVRPVRKPFSETQPVGRRRHA